MVVTMNEPQVWTLIGVFAAAIFAMLGLVSGLFPQVVRAEIGRVGVQIEALDRKVDVRSDALERRVERLERKVDDIDRDVQAISRRVFPDSP
jgi:uncharacterized membrane protein YciS (DUF1049 family)